MSSDTIRYIVGYTLAIFAIGFLIVMIGIYMHSFIVNAYRMVVTASKFIYRKSVSVVKYIINTPNYMKNKWPKIKELLIKASCLMIIICGIAFMLYCCYNNNNTRYHDQEDIEDIMNDPQWNVPSRYRE